MCCKSVNSIQSYVFNLTVKLLRIQVERLMTSVIAFVITVDWLRCEANCQALLGGDDIVLSRKRRLVLSICMLSGAIWDNIVIQFILVLINIFVPLHNIFMPEKIYWYHCIIYVCLIKHIRSIA